MRPSQPSLALPPLSIPARAAQEFRAYYRTCRLDGPITVYVLGWGMAGGHTGHLARAWVEDELRWGMPYAIRTTASLLAMPETTMPEGASAPEDPKK